ncbi:MAG: hypothetical protein U0163_19950 [Gemmatimonadaceae bacterium]
MAAPTTSTHHGKEPAPSSSIDRQQERPSDVSTGDVWVSAEVEAGAGVDFTPPDDGEVLGSTVNVNDPSAVSPSVADNEVHPTVYTPAGIPGTSCTERRFRSAESIIASPLSTRWPSAPVTVIVFTLARRNSS